MKKQQPQTDEEQIKQHRQNEIKRLDERIAEASGRLAAAMREKAKVYNQHTEYLRRKEAIVSQLAVNPSLASEHIKMQSKAEATRETYKFLEATVSELQREIRPMKKRRKELDRRALSQARNLGIR